MATTTATTINTQNSKSLPKSTTPAQFPATLLAVGIVVIGTVVMTAAAVAISVVFSLDGAKDLAKHNARMTLTKCGDRVSTYLGAQAETAENMQYLSNPFDLPVAPANQSYWNTSEWYLPWMERMLIYHSLTGFELQFIGIGYADGSYIGCQYDQENENYVVCMLISQVGRNMSEPSSRAVHFFNNYSKSDGTLLGSSVGEIPYDPRTRDFFIETPRVKGFAMWSNVYIAAIRNTPIVSYLKPIYSKAGNFIGVASIDLSLEQVDIIFKKTLSGYDATSFLVDNHLRLVASTLERSAFTYDRSPVGYRLTSTDIENNCQLSDAVNSWENDTWKMCQLSIASYEYQPLIDLHHKRSDLFPSSPCTIRPVMSVTGNVATSSVQPTAATTQPRLVQWCEGNTVDQSHNAAANEEVFSLKLDGEAYYAMVTSMPILSKTAEMSWRLVVLLKESTQTKQVINGRNVAIGVTVAILVVVTAVVTCVMHRVLKPLATVADDMKSAAYLRTTDNSSQGQVGTWYEGDDLDKDGVTRIVKEAKPRDKPRLLSYLSEVATIQQSYWDMADELRKLKSYIPEHIRREVLTSRKGQVGAGQSVSTTANTNFSPSEVEMSRAGSFHGIEAMPSHPVSALISDNKHSSVLTAERLHANRKTPLAGQKASDWEVEHTQISSASQSARKDASPTAGSAEEYLSDRASEAKPISVAALSEWQMASRRCGASNESPPIFFGDNVLVDRDISVALVNVVPFHRFALTHSGPTITKEHEAIVHRVHAVARRCGGVLETFMGDHFWVSFNATTLCSSHAVAATCFALEITTLLNNAAIQNMKHIKKEDTQPMDAASEAPSSQPSAFKAAPCGVTCGVSSGRAFVGPLGTDSIRRHTILSQAMPEVAALERQSIRYPNCGLLVGGDTIPAIEGYFQYLLVDATLLPGSGGKRRRIATVKGAMCAEGCNPDALRGITNLEAARSRRQNPYALVNASFEAFLEGRTAECTDMLRLAEDQIIQSGAQSDQQPLTDEAKISISMMGELIIGMLSMSPPTDGRSYRSPLGEAYMPIGDRILYESNTT